MSFSGCTWVTNSREASSVRVVPKDRVADCKNVVSISTNTVDSISVVNRNAAKVEREFETLAQNEVAQSGADNIVAITRVVDDRRTFAMYKFL